MALSFNFLSRPTFRLNGTDGLLTALTATLALEYLLVGIDRIAGTALSNTLRQALLWDPGAPYRIWTAVTYAFFHADVYHALGNLLLLYFAGHAWEDRKNTASVWLIFLVCAAAGAAVFAAIKQDSSSLLVGASGGIFGILGALTARQPRYQFKLTFWWMPLYALSAGLCIVESTWAFAGGDAPAKAHLAGFGLGFAVPALQRWGIFVGRGSSQPSSKKSSPLTVLRGGKSQTPASVLTGLRDPDARLNAVLDKIGRSGVESLTEDERAFLEKLQK